MDFFHQPVLGREIVKHLITDSQGIYIDCTLGEGGHSELILKALSTKAQLIGLDADSDIQKIACERLKRYPMFLAKNVNFNQLSKILKELNLKKVSGIFADLGISMYHYKKSLKGFSFLSHDALDMTLNGTHPNAFDVVNKMSVSEVGQILKIYGEEENYYRIASFIEYYRTHIKLIETNQELAMVIQKALESLYKKKSTHRHYATKSFQAIRIYVNQELDNLKILLQEGLQHLKSGGRFVILTYHSLEDRLVKEFFKKNEKEVKILFKKPIIASAQEVSLNPASRSAKLRIYTKI